MASGDLDKFIPITVQGPSTSTEDIALIKVENSRPPSSSHTSISEDALSPPSHFFSEEEEDEEESDQEEQVESDLDMN